MRVTNARVLATAAMLGIESSKHTTPGGFTVHGFTKEQAAKIALNLNNKALTDRQMRVAKAKQLIEDGMTKLGALKKVGLSWSSFNYKVRPPKPKRTDGLMNSPELASKLGGWNVGYVRRVAMDIMHFKPVRIDTIGKTRKVFWWNNKQYEHIKRFLKERNRTWLQVN
jgi:hypothetical protein